MQRTERRTGASWKKFFGSRYAMPATDLGEDPSKQLETLDEAVVFLNQRGVSANRRRWILGDTVVVTSSHASELVQDIEVFDKAVSIVCVEGTWRITVFADGVREDFQRTSLNEACELVLELVGEGERNVP